VAVFGSAGTKRFEEYARGHSPQARLPEALERRLQGGQQLPRAFQNQGEEGLPNRCGEEEGRGAPRRDKNRAGSAEPPQAQPLRAQRVHRHRGNKTGGEHEVLLRGSAPQPKPNSRGGGLHKVPHLRKHAKLLESPTGGKAPPHKIPHRLSAKGTRKHVRQGTGARGAKNTNPALPRPQRIHTGTKQGLRGENSPQPPHTNELVRIATTRKT